MAAGPSARDFGLRALGRSEPLLCTLCRTTTPGEAGQGIAIEPIAGNHSNATWRHGAERGGPAASLEKGHLAQDGTRSHLRDGMAVDFDRQYAVEQQEQLIAGFTLVDKCFVLPQFEKRRIRSDHEQ